MILLDRKLKSLIPRLGVVFLLLSFGLMTGLAPVLHAHELDLSAPHDDCAPCHWSQSNQSVETAANAIHAASQVHSQLLSPGKFIGQQFISNVLNRGPPLPS